MTHTEACLALNMVPQMGPVRLRKLLGTFGEPESILRAPADRLQAVEGIGPEVARRLAKWEDHVDLPAELARMHESGVHALTPQCEGYPPALRDIYDPPIVLYVWGELTERDARAIGVVGSRRPSHYGLETAKKLSFQLAYAGWTIASGLARGVDTAAHSGALAAKGRTVAVLGCGLGGIYPPENFTLAEKIATGAGAVISEFSMEVRPDKQTFPMRNRIISGMSQGLLVVEAGANSGALISAGQAADQGRAVFAVPGQIDRPEALGSNRLIQQGARLVIDAGDVLDELQQLFLPAAAARPLQPDAADAPVGPGPTRPSPEVLQPTVATVTPAAALSPAEAAVLGALDITETPVDLIIRKCGLPTAQVSSTLFALEMKRMVRQLPGKLYVRTS